MSVNKLIILGHLGQDPEIKEYDSFKVCNFSVATNFKYNDVEEVTWHNVTAFNTTGENCAKYLKKGQQVYVEGRLKIEDYEDKEGVKKKAVKVVAERVQFLSAPKAEATAAPDVPNAADKIPF